jgi:predicted Zn-dependent peptidase
MTIQVTELANGLRVATDQMDSVETASIGVWADVGTRNEPAEVNGVSHLLEHMAFKGTERRSARAIAEEIEAVGGHLNAYTAREQTAYYAKILAADLPLAVDIIADILQYSTFDDEELTRERAVVLQEIGQAEDTPDDIVFDYFQTAAFPNQAMGRPVLGQAEIVRDLPREAIRDYMRLHYSPQRLVLSAAGQVDHAQLVEMASRAFVNLPRGNDGAPEPARYAGGEIRIQRDLEQVHIVLGLPGVGYLDPDYYALGVLSTLFGGGMSSRLFQEIREKRGLVYSIYSFGSSFRDGGLFGVYAGTGEAEAAEILPLVIEELRHLPTTVTADELARAKAQAKAGVLMARESTSNRAEQLATHLLTYGRPLSPEEIIARIEAVDIAHIARVARRLMSGPPTLAALGPLGRLARLDAVAGRLAA